MNRLVADRRTRLLSVAALALVAGVTILLISLEPAGEAVEVEGVAVTRSADVPDLPFEDNPDPNACGIPVQWGSDGQAWLTGEYEGELIQPTVLLYDSHLRQNVVASAPHGAEVEIVLFQENPVLDYYLVKIPGAQAQEGWIPAPFLAFEPVS